MARSSVAYAVAGLALAGAVALAAACKSSTGGDNCGNSSTPPDITGTYALISVTTGTVTYLSPAASGTMRIHPGTYHVGLLIPSQSGGTLPVTDSGNYNIVGASCIQEFSLLNQPNFSGSFKLNADSTFHLSGTANGQVAASLWKKS